MFDTQHIHFAPCLSEVLVHQNRLPAVTEQQTLQKANPLADRKTCFDYSFWKMTLKGGKITGANTVGLHPSPETFPITAGESLSGCSTPPEQLARLFEAAGKYRSFKYWHKVRVGSSESRITGQGFNAVKFNPKKPARTVRRNDGKLGMHGAMHWSECRRFSLPEFKRFGSFPDDFVFAGEFEEGIRQIGNCVPPLFMRAIARHIREKILSSISSGERAA